MAGAPDKIKQLVDTFLRNIEFYKSGTYNETQLRREYLDPFFTVLGWDVENKRGYAEAYKDVIHEYSLKTKDVREAPDYCFRIGGTRKFFVEAKKPGVNLKDDVHPAFQVRSYAWSAKLPLSVLTDFEEFAVYDCRIPPNKKDKASTARTMYYNFDEYIEKWDEIEEVFSRESVLKGSFDKYVESNKKKRGTAEVDAVFLQQMEEWRKMLARNIALRNPSLSIRELNFAVQKTIDRIIFLRICEDRGIEDYGQLMSLQNGTSVYDRLKQIYHRADEKYNSGLFHFEQEKERNEPPDGLTLDLSIDDKVIKDIVKHLYYPESPYEFAVLPADILGQVYEQFLGKVIRLTPAHQAVIEDKPEVKKAGGVYYTPTYIVNYIVENTLGRLLDGKTSLKEAAGIKVLDPACGSGSFLIGAFQYLTDWHLKLYTADEKSIEKYLSAKNPPVYQAMNGSYLLTTSEKKRILLNNIYGVDIDSQAVEVTKLSLLLKVLEGESEETISNQLKFFRERALPDLSGNIKCGNSLIGPDFYDQMEMNFIDDEEKLRINVFDWKREFKEIMDRGGFDVVIGNPPYVRQELLGTFKEYFENNYKVYNGIADLYSYFIERAVNLLRRDGYFSYIVANKWIRANYGTQLRDWLKKQNLTELIDFGDLPVFKGATTYPCIINIMKGKPDEEFYFSEVPDLKFTDLREAADKNKFKVNLSKLESNGWKLVNEQSSELINKINSAGIPFLEYVNGKIYYGIKTGLNKAFVINEETKIKLIAEDEKCSELIKPFLLGRDIKRYKPLYSDKYLIFTRRGIDINNYPSIKGYLMNFKSALEPKPKNFNGEKWKGRKPGSYQWYEIQDTIDYYHEFEKPKIIYPEISIKGQFTIDKDNYYSETTSYIIGNDSLYLLGILNSKVWSYLFKMISASIRGGYLRWKRQYMAGMPVPITNPKRTKQLESLVQRILDLNNSFLLLKTPQEKTALQRQIDATDRQIDQLVYELYGLTDEEIGIVEGG